MKTEELGSEKLLPLMFRLALPSLASYLINILYSVVDRVYIGHLSSTSSAALTGVGLCLPVLQMISAFSAFAGSGGAPLCAIELGKKEKDQSAQNQAQKIFTNAFFLLILFSVIITIAVLLFYKEFLFAFGASENTFPYARDYLCIYAGGTIFVQLALGLNPFISCQGHAKTAMISVFIGAVLNIALDPLFIFILGMGVKGAAWATVISQGISALWIFFFFYSKNSCLKINMNIFKPDFSVIIKIAALGISPFVMTITESGVYAVYNYGLHKFGGDYYVGAMTLIQNVQLILYVPLAGFCSGIQPLISYNYGALKYSRMKFVISRMLFISGIIEVLLVLSVRLFSKYYIGIFTSDRNLTSIAAPMLRFYILGMYLMWIQHCAQTVFVALGKAKISVFIACLRKIVLLIPLAFILPYIFGVKAIFCAEPCATFCSATTSAFVLFFLCKKIWKENV
ncbi:MAG: MATE family efflux transporter [Treponema sp.]|nr:MATE family efflux transporter [Treponema sp.]